MTVTRNVIHFSPPSHCAVTDDALELVTRLVSIYLEEAVVRSAGAAGEASQIDLVDLEKIVHHLITDF